MKALEKNAIGAVLVLLVLNYTDCGDCPYMVAGNDDDIEVDSTKEIGTSVATLMLVEAGYTIANDTQLDVGQTDLILDTNSSHFKLKFNETHHDVVVKSCLPVGWDEVLEVSIGETKDPLGVCTPATVVITVVPPEPQFDLARAVQVDVVTCGSEIITEVLPIKILNDGTCTAWNCSISCTNDAKTFWMDTEKIIQTSIDNINFSFVYDIMVTCVDESVPPEEKDDSFGEITLEITFVNNSICMSSLSMASTTAPPPTSSVTSSKGLTISDTTTGDFFDKPSNVALVSSVSGFTVGATGAAVSILASRKCKPSINPTAEP